MRRFAWAIGIVLAGALLGAGLLLRGSLPQLDGTRRAAGLTAPVELLRDARGAVTIRARTEADAAYVLGFAHAQDRFFQMDVARRVAAGELAEIFGAAALAQDRGMRRFRLRARSRAAVAAASPQLRRWLERYADGVNAGRRALRARPFEYWLLRARARPWRSEDALLVAYSMAWQLHASELALEKFRLALAASLTAPEGGDAAAARAAAITQMLLPHGSDWDAPIFATRAAADAAAQDRSPQLPSPQQLDLRGKTLSDAARAALALPLADPPAALGSNNWALDGRHTASGAALVANDMHLGLAVPPTWYRLRLIIGERIDASGVSLPGIPTLIAGSNGYVAWGFTNSYGDWFDLERVECEPAALQWWSNRGAEPMRRYDEPMYVRGRRVETLSVFQTARGVLYEQDAGGSCLIARWWFTSSGPLQLGLVRLLTARTAGAAVALAPGSGVPQQNMIVGDRAGTIGWTIAGRVPGPTHPTIVAPEEGMLWTANARAVDGAAEAIIGGDEWRTGAGGYDLGARARQIRDALRALSRPVDPQDLLRIQLDDRALFLARWRAVLLGVLDEEAIRNAPARAELRQLAENWDGRAGVDSVGYRLVRRFHRVLERSAWAMLLGALGLDPRQFPPSRRFDATLWRLVSEQPPHLLTREFADWRAFLLAQVDATIAALRAECPRLARCRWGDVNRSGVRHSLSRSLPLLARWLDMPDLPLPGDHDMPRVHQPGFGVSVRFAVSPGHEAQGYLQIAGGQSGHPLSPFYRSGFDEWVAGAATPFLPGPPAHKLQFLPETP
ncbi:MAG: penicillin acylase family protein [Steroidobacteraceae bacterium]|nr:penicillin acylase family protein [Steroidobacteraceae bacterium]MDW8259425.1 penicillin acylase family protein [Gammaproteobacteria bacterium]